MRTENAEYWVMVSVEFSEAEVHWRKFSESLSERGLHGVEMITSDNHAELKAARQSVFPSVSWQRCQFQLKKRTRCIKLFPNKESLRKTATAQLKRIR